MDGLPVQSTHYWFIDATMLLRMDKNDTRSTVIANINMLMEMAGESQHSLARRLGWRQSTLGNLLSGRHNIAVERAEAIANAYGLNGWHLLLKDLPRDLSESKTLSRLFTAYLASSREGREYIERVAEREAAYKD